MQELTQGSVCKFILRTVYKVSFIQTCSAGDCSEVGK